MLPLELMPLVGGIVECARSTTHLLHLDVRFVGKACDPMLGGNPEVGVGFGTDKKSETTHHKGKIPTSIV